MIKPGRYPFCKKNSVSAGVGEAGITFLRCNHFGCGAIVSFRDYPKGEEAVKAFNRAAEKNNEVS